MKICSIPGCLKQVQSRGWCTAHYTKWRRWGDPEGTGPLAPNGLTREELFIRKINKTDTCWLWTGKIDNRGRGYGVFTFKIGGKPKTVLAHKFAYNLWAGEVPTGLSLDHVYDRGCRFTHCVNPMHLEPITPKEQNRRHYSRQTHCKHGHEFTPENTYINSAGARVCRECGRERTRRWQEKQRDLPSTASRANAEGSSNNQGPCPPDAR